MRLHQTKSWKSQVSIEYLFLIGGGMLFVVLVLIATRTQLFGAAEHNLNDTGVGITHSLVSIPPAPNGTSVPTDFSPVYPPTPITNPTCPITIDHPGEWLLTNDVIGIGPCITIDAPNVELVCQNGAQISNSSPIGIGVRIWSPNAKVTGCRINGFSTGIYVGPAAHNTEITYNTILSSLGVGIFLQTGSHGSTVANNYISPVAVASSSGIQLDAGTWGNLISTNNIQAPASDYAINLIDDSNTQNNVIRDNIVAASTCGIFNCIAGPCSTTCSPTAGFCTGNTFENNTVVPADMNCTV